MKALMLGMILLATSTGWAADTSCKQGQHPDLKLKKCVDDAPLVDPTYLRVPEGWFPMCKPGTDTVRYKPLPVCAFGGRTMHDKPPSGVLACRSKYALPYLGPCPK